MTVARGEFRSASVRLDVSSGRLSTPFDTVCRFFLIVQRDRGVTGFRVNRKKSSWKRHGIDRLRSTSVNLGVSRFTFRNVSTADE